MPKEVMVYAKEVLLTFGFGWVIIAIFGIAGNVFIIAYTIKKKLFKNVFSCFVTNLAVADIVFLTFCVSMSSLQYIMYTWSFPDVICQLAHYLTVVSVEANSFTLTMLTASRCTPIIMKKIGNLYNTPRKVLFLSIFVWCAALIVSTPHLSLYGVRNVTILMSNVPESLNHKSNLSKVAKYILIKECGIVSNHSRYINTVMIVTSMVQYILPLTAMIYCYGALSIRLKQTTLTDFKSEINRKVKVKRRKRVNRLTAIVVLTFAICWLPTTIYTFWIGILPDRIPVYSQILLIFKSGDINIPCIAFRRSRTIRDLLNSQSNLNPRESKVCRTCDANVLKRWIGVNAFENQK
ncbi:hypothetical protein GJ496_004948 [Pomphorhynchus laevis]|nr:hypothetical protein GJ496_004948 [Pomphorhynchus laevis]